MVSEVDVLPAQALAARAWVAHSVDVERPVGDVILGRIALA
ncbi:hypothetical protein ACFQW6_10070 [Nocardioides sp. GCM10028917]